jgi:hypothetical protein
MNNRNHEPNRNPAERAPETFSSSPRDGSGTHVQMPSRGSFFRRHSAHSSEDTMTERTHNVSRYATRAALVGLGLYLALVVGVPWLINHAPPSAQDVVAAAVCCVQPASAKTPGAR